MSKHAVSAHSCLWTVHLTLWVVSLHSAWAQEMVHGRVNVPGTSTNTTADGSLPPSLNVDLNLTASDLHLNFVKDPDINPDLPVYTLYTDSNGKLQIQHQNMDNAKTFGVYQDVTNGAAVGVTREVDENGTSYFNLEGVLHSQGKVYDVKNFRPDDGVQERRRRDVSNNVTNDVDVLRREGEQEFELKQHAVVAADVFDYLPKPPFIQKKKEMTSYLNISHPTAMPLGGVPTSRRKRAVTQDVYVDVVALADYAVYVDWYDRSTASTPAAKQQDALEKIRRYYAFVFNGVNLLYKSITTLSYTIHVRLSSVVVATSGGSSQWTEKYKVTAPQWDEVDANSALADLSAWAQTTSLLPSYDHLMLFSGYDLTKAVTGGGISDKITGLAYTSTLCDVNGKASSIVEDLGGFQCVSTAAHELGHGLSAEHDGTENICLSTDRYIMAAGTSTETAANKLHPWLFSSCSVNYFNTFLADRVRFERGRTCLYSSLTTNTNIPDVSSQLPGQLYDVDAQCRQVYGPNSRLCRGPEFGSAADVCTDMYCYDPTTTSTCFMLVAARGTSCGNKKWCDDGECVYNSAAPALADNCVFGDQPGVAFDGKDCATFVRNFPGYCYQEVVRGRCCKSCSDYYKPVQNCEYGDKASGCSSLGCNRGDTSYLNSCCGTCNYGDPIVTTTTTARPTTTSTTRPTSTTTTATPSGVFPTTTSPGTAANGTCVDDPSIFINQQRCSGIVASTTEMCYDAQVQKYCCASCRARYTGVAGCEFGDQNTNYCNSQGSSACGLQLGGGNTFDAYCCGTCNYIPSMTTTTTSSTSTTTTTTTPTPTTTTTTPPTTTTTTPRPTTTPTRTTTTTMMPKPTTTITTPTTTITTPTTTTTTTTTPRPTIPSVTTTTTSLTSTTTTTTTPTPTTTTTTPTTTTTTTTTTPRPTTTPTTTTTTTTMPKPTTTNTTPTTTTTTPTTTTTTTTTPRPTTTTTTATTTTTTTPKPTSTTTTPTTMTTTTTPRPTTTIPTTTTTNTTAPNPSSTTTTSTTTTTTTIKPSTPEIRTTTTVPPTCVDVSYNACVNVSRDRSVCYNVTLASLCCASCSRLVNSNNPGCEFGDRKPIQCSSLIPGSSTCARALSVCCQTCGDLSSSQPKNAAVTSLLVMFAAAVLSVIVSER